MVIHFCIQLASKSASYIIIFCILYFSTVATYIPEEAKIQYIVGKWYFLRAKLIISVIACKF